ncbi:hypothetical protein [Specibacter cremeus]|uniref:hypothetical protein n=1 Tax=Specibacter cremeus TaxID=1629051 RepID=UPI000F79620B|nr:hypothetical protein [Specibacter cremeus]
MDIYDTLAGDQPRQANNQSMVSAALHTSIVTLTAAIASPYWEEIAHSHLPAPCLERISDGIIDGRQPRGVFGPLRHWGDTNWPPDSADPIRFSRANPHD